MSYGQEVNRQLQNTLFGKAPNLTPPANIFVSLHTGDPGEDGNLPAGGRREFFAGLMVDPCLVHCQP